MSRIGRLPVVIPAGVTVNVTDSNEVIVKGPLGELSQKVDKNISVAVEGTEVHVTRHDEQKEHKAMHGLYRKLIANMVEGVTKGFQKALIVNGVGYKVVKQGNKIVINCGYSHPVEVVESDGITFEVPNANEIVVKGISREKVGQVAANIKVIKVPDPYHVYGIRYKDETIIRKEAKKSTK